MAIITVFTASLTGYTIIALLPNKIEIPYATTIIRLAQKRAVPSKRRGTFRIAKEVLHPT